jgi:hypothetical protein
MVFILLCLIAGSRTARALSVTGRFLHCIMPVPSDFFKWVSDLAKFGRMAQPIAIPRSSRYNMR